MHYTKDYPVLQPNHSQNFTLIARQAKRQTRSLNFSLIRCIPFCWQYKTKKKCNECLFWKLLVRLWVTDLPCHVATARKQWGDFLLSCSLHCRECLSRHFAYLGFLYNPAPPGKLVTFLLLKLVHTWRRLQARYLEENYYYVSEIYLASVCTR